MSASVQKKIRYILVGAGNIAQVAVLPAFRHANDNSELAAICSSDEEKREVLGRSYQVPCGSYEEFEQLAKDTSAQAVYIALPNHLHRAYTERAAQIGLHVLCEKPMATTAEDCQAMIDVTKEKGVKLMIAYRLHFEEANLRAVEMIRAGRIGKPVMFSGFLTQQVRQGDVRTQGQLGGGAMADAGIYPLNAARYLFADEPTEVSAYSLVDGDPRFKGVDETTVVQLRFGEGRFAQLGASQGAAHCSTLRVLGTEGELELQSAFEYVGERKLRLTVGGKTEEHTFKKSDQFAPELLYFSRCILESREPEPSGQEGLADVRVIQAIAQSAKSGMPVKLEPFTRDVRPGPEQIIVSPWSKPPEPVNAPAPAIA